MQSYQNMSDEELIAALRSGEKEITDYLMDKYKSLVKKKAKALYLIGGETDDLIQEGMIGLFKAVRDYQPDKDSSFFHFADLCIARQMYTAVEASNRKKHAYKDGIKHNPIAMTSAKKFLQSPLTSLRKM